MYDNSGFCLEVLEDRTLLTGPAPVSTVDGLIAAINAANSSGSPATITLASSTTFNFTAANNKTDGANALPVISGNVTIEGNNSTVEGAPWDTQLPPSNPFRFFDVAKGASLTLDNLELNYGVAYGSGVSAEGGAIYNQGSLTLTSVAIDNSVARGSDVASGKTSGAGKNGQNAAGGGIYSAGGTVIIDNGGVSGIAQGGNGTTRVNDRNDGKGGNGSGGGLYVASGTVILHYGGVSGSAMGGDGAGVMSKDGSVTTTGSNGGNGGNGKGGGLYVAGGTVILIDCPIEGASASGGNGGDGHSGHSGKWTEDNEGSYTGVGGNGGDGGKGGNGIGGGLYVGGGTVNLNNTQVSGSAGGGGGGDGGRGGDGGQLDGSDGGKAGQNGKPGNGSNGGTGETGGFGGDPGDGSRAGNGGNGGDGGNGSGSGIFVGGGTVTTTTGAATLTPTQPTWDTSKGGVVFGYQESGLPVWQDTEVALYWSSGDNWISIEGQDPVYTKDVPAGTPVGTSVVFNASAEQLGQPPDDAKYLLVVTDPNNVLGNFDPSKNVAAIAYTPKWTGDGSNDLWSNGLNWLGGYVPKAGDDLLFPTGATQLSSEDDLGYSFNSVTIQGNYDFSGQTLTVTGPLDVQQGSAELDCSKTVNGITSVEAGATLTVGNGATLTTGAPTSVVAVANPAIDGGTAQPADSTDSLVVKGNLALKNNSSCDINGDASVENGGTLSADAGCNADLAANSNFSLLGKMTFADKSTLTLNLDGNLDVGATGALSTSGNYSLLGNMTTVKGSTWDASGDTDIKGKVQYGGATQIAGGTWTYEAGAVGEVVAGGSVTSAGNQTFKAQSQCNVDANAQWVTQAGTVDASGSWNCQGNYVIDLGADLNFNPGSHVNFAGEFDNNGGSVNLVASQTTADGDQFLLNGKYMQNGGSLTVGYNTQLENFGTLKIKLGFFSDKGSVNGPGKFIDGDAITVAAGGTLDVSGSLTEDAGGHLDVSGTVTIEPGASLDNFTTITIEQGGSLNDSAKITIEPAGVLDVMGGLSVSNTGSLNVSGTMNVANGATYSSQGAVTVTPGGTLNLPKTSTAISLSNSTPRAGVDLVTLTATVTGLGSSNGTPTGTVDFIGTTTKTDLGKAALVNGIASLKVGPFAEGTHNVTATYSGDSDFPSSSGTATLTVQASPPSTAPAPPPSTAPEPPPSLNILPLLSLLNSLFGGGTASANADGSETVTDSLFGIPLLVSTFDVSGNLVSVTLFGIDITVVFSLL